MTWNPADWSGWPAYLGVFVAAAVEGEVVFASACVLVALGRLSAAGVLVAGALGGSAGDQLFFYACRGRLRPWLSRFPRVARRQELVASRVRQHAWGMMLACRFLPGLRIAIPVACAYAEISPVQFSVCSLVGAGAWAGAVMLIIVLLGPGLLAELGIHAWWTQAVPALLVVGFFWWLGRVTRRG